MEKFESHFDAKAELKNIRHPREDETAPSKEERLALRKHKIMEIKEKLADQMLGIAEINAGLENIASDSGIALESKKMQEFLEEYATKHRLAPWQMEEYKTAVEKIKARNELIYKFFSENEGKSDEELFEELFGEKPQEKVSIEKSSLCPIFICGNQDFRNLYTMEYSEIEESDKHAAITKSRVDHVEGVAIHVDPQKTDKFSSIGNAFIVINRAAVKDPEDMKMVILHEKKHIFDSVVFPNVKETLVKKALNFQTKLVENLSRYSDEELNNMSPEESMRLFMIKPIEGQIRLMREASEETAKRETLAYYKQGDDAFSIYYRLKSSHDGTGYAVIDERVLQAFRNQIDSMPTGHEEDKALLVELFEKMHQREERLYKKHLQDATDAISELERIGMSRNEVVGLFETEPLANWNKILVRIKNSNKYEKGNKIASLKDALGNIEFELRMSEENIKNYEQELRNPSETNSNYKYWQEAQKAKYDTYEQMLEDFLKKNKERLAKELKDKKNIEDQLAELEK